MRRRYPKLGKRDDFFWFTFFHEAAHLLFHGKRLTFVEGRPDGEIEGEYDGETDEEEQANRYAADFLIPPGSLDEFHSVVTKGRRISLEKVLRKAQELRIAPGIVVGRLQYEGWLERSHLNSLRVRVKLGN